MDAFIVRRRKATSQAVFSYNIGEKLDREKVLFQKLDS